MENTEKLSKKMWDSIWNGSTFKKYYGMEKYLARHVKLHKLFKKVLPKGNKKILELGCGSAKQLIYFAKEFGYEVSGIDYSENSVAIAKANLETANVKGTILCENMFETSLGIESFDIVYSQGLIEHFDNLEEAINAHLRLLKKGGTLLITVPNIRNNLYLSLSRVFKMRTFLLATHNLDAMDKKILEKLFSHNNLEIVMLDYYCPIDFTCSLGITESRFITTMVLLISQVAGYFSFFMPSSRYLSPWLVAVVRKK